ncbi:MAG TPA: ATP-binding cassette domain-containing protein [Acidimicrobiales bacterium]|nr:ATP-binding cassette domain-containing protein [Acidimicrobiales bacterium]
MTSRRRIPRAGGPLAWLGAVVAVYLAVPVAAFLVRLATTDHAGFSQPGLFPALWISAAGATISTTLIALFGIPLAWVLARSRSRLASIAGALVYLPLAVPPLIGGILLIYLVGPYTWLGRLSGHRLTDSLAGVVLAQTFVAAPFLIVAARSAFAAEDRSFDEVAAALGHRPLARFFRVGLPGASAGIRAGLLLSWLRAFGEYGATVLLAYHPSSLPVYTYTEFSSSGLADIAAPTALALGVATVVVALARAPLRPRARLAAGLPPPAEPVRGPALPVSFDLEVRVGSFRLRAAHRAGSHRLAIVGPSGSGKSLTLRCLAGLLGPEAGRVCYGAEPVDGTPVEDRGIGYVAQGYHLLPHLDAWRQATFGVGADPGLASHWLDTLGLSGLADRLPSQMSGGQRQRLCLAQALARRPRLLLLDEPFSALDTPVRAELGRELRRLQRHAGLSTVLVTHDPAEAALLADDIVVLVGGRIEQAGSARDLHARPASPLVARLMGVPNIHAGRSGTGGRLEAAGLLFDVPTGAPPGTPVTWCVRPGCVAVRPNGAYPARLLDAADVGSHVVLEVELGAGLVLTAHVDSLPAGYGPCRVALDPAGFTVWTAPPGEAQDLAPDRAIAASSVPR